MLNRAVARLPLFEKKGDYEVFERVLDEDDQRTPTRILADCVMPDHRHFVLWPKADHELTAFVRWLTHTHTMRWHAHHHTSCTGHLYQGRFKSFPVQSEGKMGTSHISPDKQFYAIVLASIGNNGWPLFTVLSKRDTAPSVPFD